MAGKGTVTLSVIGDVEQAKAKFRELGIEVDHFGQKAKSSGERLANLGSKMSMNVTLPIVAGLGLATKAASDLEQSVGAVESIFGEAKRPVEEFGETAAETAGLSKRQVNEMAAVIGASLQGMGYEADEAASTVVTLEQRAADMAATFGGTTEEAIQAVASALRGERDPIERYGASLKQVDIDARVAAMGLDTSTVAAKKKSEAAAALDLILQATASTEGAFAREQDTTAGATARARAQLENSAATLGDKLLPIAAEAADKVAFLAEKFASLPGAVQTGILALAGIAAVSGPILTAAGNVAKLTSALSKVNIAALAAKGGLVGTAVAIAGLVTAASLAAEGMESKIGDVLDQLTAKFSELGDEDLAEKWRDLGGDLETFEAIAERNVGVAIRLRDALKAQGEETGALDAIIDTYVTKQKNAETSTKAATDAVSGETAALGVLGEEAEGASESLEKLLDITNSMFNSTLDYEQSVLRTRDALVEYHAKVAEVMTTKGEDVEANRALEESILATAEAILGQSRNAADAAVAQSELTDEAARAELAAKTQREELERVAQTLAPTDPLRKRLNEYIYELASLEGKHVTTTIETVYVSRGSPGSAPIRLMASGGRFQRGETAVVGEEGPELVTFGAAGTVIPNNKIPSRALSEGQRGGAVPVVNVTVNVAGSVQTERDLVRAVRVGLVEELRRNPTLQLT